MVIKKIVFICAFLFGAILSISSEHIPGSTNSGIQYQSRIAVIGNLENWNPYLELSGNLDSKIEPSYYHILTGSYYRLHKNLKIGAFYLLQGGSRHDDDWTALNPGWEWRNSINRIENNLMLDITPRFIIPYILNRKTVSFLKIRYKYNFYNNQQTILFKPGINYFNMRDRKPVWNAGLSYSFYIPLNFSEVFLYEHGPYINIIYHINELLKLEARSSIQFKTWTTGADSLALGDSYSVTENKLIVGLGIIITP